MRLPNVTLGGLFDLTLGIHFEQDDKEQNGLIFGDLRDWRADRFTNFVSALAYDVDGWLTFDEVVDRQEAHGHFGLSWTTYNNGRGKTLSATGEVAEWRRTRVPQLHRTLHGCRGTSIS